MSRASATSSRIGQPAATSSPAPSTRRGPCRRPTPTRTRAAGDASRSTPLATFTGWNPRHPDQGAPGDLMSMMGSTLPFPRTRAERLAKGDPRRAIEERYPSRAAYLEKVRTAALALVAARHMLAEDLDAIVEHAGRLWDWVQARVM